MNLIKVKQITGLLVLSSVLSTQSYGAEGNKKAYALPKIEVQGEVKSLWKRRLDNLMPITEITREEFKNKPNTGRLGDIINRMPGVFMGGTPGENKDIRLRGMDKEFTRFEFSGIQLPGGGEKREFQVNRLSPFAVGAVKILRNPTAEYESDGIAGRVVADMREIPKELEMDFKGAAGGIDSIDADQRTLSFGVGDRVNDSFGFNLFIDYNRFPLEKDKKKTKFKPDGKLKETETENEDKPNDSYNIVADTAYFYDQGEIHFKPIWNRLEEKKNKHKLKAKAGKEPDNKEIEKEEKNQETLGATLSNEHHWVNGVLLESDVSYMTTTEDKPKTKQIFKNKDKNFILDKTEVRPEEKEDKFWQFRSKLTKGFDFGLPQTLKTGFHVRLRERYRSKKTTEISAKDGKAKDKTKPKDNYELEEDYFALFIQDEIQLNSKSSWSFGLRAEQVKLSSASGDGTQGEETFTDINPSTHINYSLSDNWSVNGAVSRTVNRAKFDEIAPFEEEKDDRFVQGNPNVEPATSINFDLGIAYATSKVLFAVNLFNKEVDGVIEEVDTGIDKDDKDVFRVENVGDGWIRGIELEQKLELGMLNSSFTGLSLWANEAFFDSELTDRQGNTRHFNDQPDIVANFGFEYAHKPTEISFNLAAQYRDEISKKKEGGESESEKSRWTLDLGLRKQINDESFIYFNAINLTNASKEKTKIKANGERELEKETTGKIFIVGIQRSF